MQVLETALKIWGLTCTSIDSPSSASAAKQPENEEAFILNLQVMLLLVFPTCVTFAFAEVDHLVLVS